MNDLVLNAVALGAILDIDSIAFDALMPARVQTTMQNLEAVQVKCTRATSQFEAASLLLAAAALAASAEMLLVLPLSSDMLDVKHSLCGGRQNFVVTSNVETQLLWVADTQTDEASSILQDAVADAVHLGNWESSRFLRHARSFAEFSEMKDQSMENLASMLMMAISIS